MKQVAYLIPDAINKAGKQACLFQKSATKSQEKKTAPKTGNLFAQVSLNLNLEKPVATRIRYFTREEFSFY